MARTDKIEIAYNIEMFLRERGKLKEHRKTHNIFVNVGRTWISKLVYDRNSPVVKYMGCGIGGSKQTIPQATQPPLNDYLPLTNTQTDTNPAITQIERPVRVTGGSGPPPSPNDTWLKAIADMTEDQKHPTFNSSLFICVFTELEISYAPYMWVPVSELGLFTDDAVVGASSNQLVAYDTCSPISKTSALELEVRWTFIF